MFNLAVDPRERHTIWGVLFGYSWLWLSVFGVSQTQVSVGADSDRYFVTELFGLDSADGSSKIELVCCLYSIVFLFQ